MELKTYTIDQIKEMGTDRAQAAIDSKKEEVKQRNIGTRSPLDNMPRGNPAVNGNPAIVGNPTVNGNGNAAQGLPKEISDAMAKAGINEVPSYIKPISESTINILRGNSTPAVVAQVEEKTTDGQADNGQADNGQADNGQADNKQVVVDDNSDQKKIKELTITPEDMDSFMECILNDTPYTEKMNIYSGRMAIEVRTLSVEEMNIVQRKLSNEEMKFNFQYDVMHYTYMMCYALKAVVLKTKTINCDEGSFDDRYNRIKKFDSAKFLAISEALGAFNRKVAKINQEAQMPNF